MVFNNIKSFQSGQNNFYHTTIIAITTPMIINTHAPNIPPTSIGRLSDDVDSNCMLFKVSRKNVDNSYDFFFLEKEFRLEYNN